MEVTRQRLLFGLALAVRLVLVAYGAWQDENFAVKYTDIDYVVVTDGARFVFEGGSPFERATYRYTPLLAYLYLGNLLWTPIWGKLLVVAADLVVGFLLLQLLRIIRSRYEWADWTPPYSDEVYVALWLFNPFGVNVSTRGNAESLVAMLVLGTLYLLFTDRHVLAAIVYGLSVHFKIYPIIYSIALFLFVGLKQVRIKPPAVVQGAHTVSKAPLQESPAAHTRSKTRSRRNSGASASPRRTRKPRVLLNKKHFTEPPVLSLFNRSSFQFALISGFTFLLLLGIFYYIYGFEFVYETYLYHWVRKDNRHNFSVYFYHIYLSTAREITLGMSRPYHLFILSFIQGVAELPAWQAVLGKVQNILMFLPQASLMLVLTWFYYRSILFCVFIQTFVFVALNKVCTVQYFIWYFSLLPLILPYSRLSPRKGVHLFALWLGTQLAWLYMAYQLEFLGMNTFTGIFVAGVAHFLANAFIAATLIKENTYFPW